MTEVRRALLADARGVAAVHVRAWHAAYPGIVPDEALDGVSVGERELVWRDVLGRAGESSFTLVATGRDERVEGFCSLCVPSRDADAPAGTAEVAATYVDPERWRRGVGGALLRAARAELAEAGWREATLWVFAANDRARSFYASFGFEPDGASRSHEGRARELIRMRAPLG